MELVTNKELQESVTDYANLAVDHFGGADQGTREWLTWTVRRLIRGR